MRKQHMVNISVLIRGYSNRPIETFLELLKEHNIEVLVDERIFPTSKIEQFKREEIERWLPEKGIEYVLFGKELVGYRQDGYRAHMQTGLFKEGIKRLLEIAAEKRTCIMCMESNPKYCHRRFISVHLERKEVKVIHIITKGQTRLLTF